MSNDQNNNHPNNTKKVKKESDDKTREKMMILHGLLPRSTMLIQGYNRSLCWEKPAKPRSDLISRVINTNIMVYAFTDLRMVATGSTTRTRTPHPVAPRPRDHVVDRRMNERLSSVRAAIRANDRENLGAILNSDRDQIRSTDREGLTPLSYAACIGSIDMVSYILNNYPTSNEYPNNDTSFPVHKACQRGHVDVLKKFRSKVRGSLLAIDSHHQTLLHVAAKERQNNLEHVLNYLLRLNLRDESGIELINKRDANGCTPWDLAIGPVKEMISNAGRRYFVGSSSTRG